MTEENQFPEKYFAIAEGSLNCCSIPTFPKLEYAVNFYLRHRSGFFRGDTRSKTIIAKEIGVKIDVDETTKTAKLTASGDLQNNLPYYLIHEFRGWGKYNITAYKKLEDLLNHGSPSGDDRIRIAKGVELKVGENK
ncbi:MAG: hypothetical protein AABX54_02185 [Nanoarchaeota archaeon]